MSKNVSYSKKSQRDVNWSTKTYKSDYDQSLILIRKEVTLISVKS